MFLSRFLYSLLLFSLVPFAFSASLFDLKDATPKFAPPLPNIASFRSCLGYYSFALRISDNAKISFQYQNGLWSPTTNNSFGTFEADDPNEFVLAYNSFDAKLSVPSEHSLYGYKAHVELQLFFDLDKSRTRTSTGTRKAVVSILMNKTDEKSPGFMNALDMFVLESKEYSNKKVGVRMNQLISKLLIDAQDFIVYPGAINTTDSFEAANRYVLATPLMIKDDEFDFILNSASFRQSQESKDHPQITSSQAKSLCAVTSRIETLFQNPGVYFLTTVVLLGYLFWHSYGRLPPETDKVIEANIWTIHPIISIILVPNKESFSRRCRIALLYVTLILQMVVECIAFRMQGYYKERSIFYFAIIGIIVSIPGTYAVGFLFRMYSRRANENERLMHYDPTAMMRFMKMFKIASLCILAVGLVLLYWQIAYLVGKLAKKWIQCFLIGAFVDLFILDSIAVLLSYKSEKCAKVLKLRGYYFEGDISFYNILK